MENLEKVSVGGRGMNYFCPLSTISLYLSYDVLFQSCIIAKHELEEWVVVIV